MRTKRMARWGAALLLSALLGITQAAGVELLADDFEDGTLDAWGAVEGTAAIVPGNLDGNGGSMLELSGSQYPTAIYQSTEALHWSNYAIEADFRFNASDGLGSAAILFGNLHANQRQENTYIASITSSGDMARLYRVEHGAWTTLEAVALPVAQNVVYRLKVEFSPGDIHFYVDGVEVLSSTDATFTRGTVGVQTRHGGGGSALAHVDNIAITRPGNQVLEERIIVTRSDGTYWQLYSMRPDGSDVVQLTSSAANKYAQRISPDGSLIAYAEGTNKIFVMDADGQNPRLVTEVNTSGGLHHIGYLSWFPDSRRLIYCPDYNYIKDKAYQINIDGTGNQLAPMPQDSYNYMCMDVSDDGDFISYIYDTVSTYHRSIRLYDVGAGTDVEVVGFSERFNPRISPDNSTIVFIIGPGGHANLYTVKTDGTAQTNITNNPADKGSDFPDWSPDGSKIIYREVNSGGLRLYTMNPDGSDKQFLVADSDHPHWSYLLVEGPSPPVAVSAPPVAATYGEVIQVPVQVADVQGRSVVSAEVFVRYDSTLLTFDQVITTGTLTEGWTIEHNRVGGTGAMQILKIAAATDQDEITADGNLLQVQFTVNDLRHPASSPLTLTHVLLNDGDPVATATDGSVTLIGVDGAIASAPGEILPRWSIGVSVYDSDEDRDPGIAESLDVQVTNDTQTEILTVTETGVNTGVFSGIISTEFSLAPLSGDGIIQAKAGDQITFTYVDSLNDVGATEDRTDTTDVLGGTDGLICATVVSQPGDTVRVRVSDADLTDAVAVSVANPRTGETETILLSQFTTGESYFYGRFFTDTQAGVVGDSTLEVAKGDTLTITYADTLIAQGGTAALDADDEVVDPFGDADGNGSVQAYDAARVLYHRLVPFLTGLDSLAANVDSLAPFGEIDPYDAALILQQVVGIFDRFPVQEPYAANHPQPETRERPKAIPETRELALQVHEGYVSVWAEERDGIVAGELQIDGLAGSVSMADELGDFLVTSRERGEGLQVVFAGAQAAVGPGELLRIYPGVGPGSAQLTRASFNGGRIVARVTESEGTTHPLSYALYANAPNPFNPQTTIGYVLPVASAVELTVYDIVGQQVRILVSGQRAAGTHQAVWDGRDEEGQLVSSGVYFYRLTARGKGNEWRSDASHPADLRFRQMRRMLLLK